MRVTPTRPVTSDVERRSGGERRGEDRRARAEAVARDRRVGRERRRHERRRRKLGIHWRSPMLHSREAPPPTDVVVGLRSAAAHVTANWHHEYKDGATGPEVTELADALVAALTRPGTTVDTRLRSVTGRRLLNLIRAQMCVEWRRRPATPAGSEILSILERFEAVRVSIEPDWGQYFASRLQGPDGLALVVEVAHDLRSPLTSVLFLAETLQRAQSGEVNELQRRQLGLIYSAALGLSEMASNVIEMARGGRRLADDQPTPFSVTAMLEAVRDMVQPMAEEKGLAIRLLPPTSDHRLGHPEALSRVLLNLTTNAMKFTEDGFVEIIGREVGLNRVEFSVRDTGPGIPPAALETLYSAFRRSPSRGEFQFSGTGLGLALCRRLVEAMGSELQVNTRPGWGTRFHFELSLCPVDSGPRTTH